MKEIRQWKEKLSKSTNPGLALDIDETLAGTNIYWGKHLMRLFGNPENLTYEEIIRKYKFTQTVPYWTSKEAIDWMEMKRRCNVTQVELPLIKDANTYVSKINELIDINLYITARPQSAILGTRIWLEKYFFPKKDIIAISDQSEIESASRWKSKVLEILYPEINGIIDDNASTVECMDKNYKGTIYLFGHETSPRNDIDVIPCLTWKDVYENIKRKTT